MLKAHIDAVEEHLLAISRIPANSGHPLHKGTPREAFIREFLTNHLNESVALGSGEIIDANSKPNEKRNQIDIVVFRRNYPRLNFGGNVTGFFAESVVATIEVKSSLDKAALASSIAAAKNVKQLTRSYHDSFFTAYEPPSILNYVVAYGGPAHMETVYNWIQEVHEETNTIVPVLPIPKKDRIQQASPSLDGVFVLGKGFLHFDNMPVSFVREEFRIAAPEIRWAYADVERGSLLKLFSFLMFSILNISPKVLNPLPYLKTFQVDELRLGS
jgi:hypothetical protein